MNKILITAGIFAFISSVSLAQDKRLSMEDAFLNVRSTLAPKTLKQLKWISQTDDLSYADVRNGQQVLIRKNAISGKETVLVNLETINSALQAVDANLKLTGIPPVEWISGSKFQFSVPNKLISFDLSSAKASIAAGRTIPAEAENADIEKQQNHIAFTIKNNLYISDGKVEKAVTSDKNENIINGKSVHREEFGISKGTFWSPNGNYLAFYRMDQSMVADYPVIDWSTKPARNINVKYPMAGEKSHEVTLGIYSVSSGKTIFVQTGEPGEQYLTNIAWSPDEQHIYIAVLNRDQNHMKLNSYNALSGAFEKTLFEEKDEKYTEPMNPVVFVKGNPGQFIWQSQRDGFNHLYLYSSSGKLIRQLTKGNWVVTDFAGFDPAGKKAFFTSTISSPLNRDFCSVDLKSGKVTRITSQEGTHAAILNDKGTLVLDHFSSSNVPRQWAVFSTSGKKLNTIFNAENPLKDYKIAPMSLFTIKSESGDDLYCRLYKPLNFDASKKYPVIVYQYGGPHAQLISNSWNGGSGDLWFQHLASRGYVVFTLDPRGSYNRGKAFEQATFRRLGDMELKDQLAGVQYLKSLPYVDSGRMGLMGWSYGGFMTTSMMTRHPGVFKVAVAGGPVIDWGYYEIMYGERYMDSPQQNPEGYKNSNVINHLDKLDGKLLLIHGAQDATVVLQHSMMLLKASVDKGKQIDYMVYPGHEHNVRGKDRVHLFEKITQYFNDNLKPENLNPGL